MITAEMILAGLDAGVVKLITGPYDKEPACQIGERWFYYATDVASGMTSEQYLSTTDMDEVIRRIVDALNDIQKYLGDSAEYLYYEALLHEVSAGNPNPQTFTGVIKETLRREVPIVAKDMEDARQKLEELYHSGSVVLVAEDFLKSSMKIYPTGKKAA